MGFGPSDSWLPTRGTTVAVCTTLIAAVIALYVYKSVSSRQSRQVRTPHVSSSFDIVRLCREIQYESLTTIDHSVRTIVNSETSKPSLYTFYQKDRTVEQSAIVTAGRFGRVDLVKYFLHNYPDCVQVDQSANLDVPVGRHHCMREVHDCSTLYAACFNGSIDIVQHLLKARASLKKTDCIRRSPLQVAAQRGHTELVEYLLSRGAQVNAADSHGYTPLLSAVTERNKDVVQCLLKNGADPCLRAKNGQMALHVAAELGNKPIVELLLQTKSLSCPRDHDSKHRLAPPYILAASRGHLPTCQLLLQAMNLTPTQTPDVLLLWGAAQVSPQHRYIHPSVQKWWTEAVELRQQHVSISVSLTPLEVYEYRSEVSTVDEVAALFSSQPPSPESYEEITYQSLLIMERCLGYGDQLVIQKILEAGRIPAGQEEMVPSWETSLSCSRDEHGSMLILEPIQSLSGWRTRVGSKSHSETHLRPSWRDAQTWLWWSSLLYLPQLCRVCFQAVWRQGPTLLQRQHSEVCALCNSYCQIECGYSIADLRGAGVECLTLGQYMQPTKWHLKVLMILSRTTDKSLCFSFRWRSTSHWKVQVLGGDGYSTWLCLHSKWSSCTLIIQSWRVFH